VLYHEHERSVKGGFETQTGRSLFACCSLIRSLDEPDKKPDDIRAEEAEKRLKAYREGRFEGIPREEIFKE